jgi:hypothetical protein
MAEKNSGREEKKQKTKDRERGNGPSFVVVFGVCLGKVVSRLCCREGSFFCVLRNIVTKMGLGFGYFLGVFTVRFGSV